MLMIHFIQVCLTQSNIFLFHLLADNKMNQSLNNHSLLTLSMEGISTHSFSLIEDNGLKDNFPYITHFNPNMCIWLLVCSMSFISQNNNNLNRMMMDMANIMFDYLKVHNLFCIWNKWFLMNGQLSNKKHYLYFLWVQIISCKSHILEDHFQVKVHYKSVFYMKYYFS